MRPKHHSYILIAVCILSRLPQLLNPEIALDGDEAICGLMLKHIVVGKEFPLYFYGQDYGFTFFESLFSIPFGLIGGVNTFTVKLPLLIMWTAGVIIFYKALSSINTGKPIIPFLLALLLATTPAWAVWCMKARGGYQSAFLLSSIILYIFFQKKLLKNHYTWLLIGAMLAIAYESQKLWIVALVPILAYKFYEVKSIKKLFFTLMGVSLPILFLKKITNPISGHKPFLVDDISILLNNINRVPEYLYSHFSARYYLAEIYPNNLFTALSAYIYIASVIIITIIAIYFLIRKRKKQGLYFASVLSIVFVIIIPSTTSLFVEPRYLLPLSVCILLSTQMLLNKVKYQPGFAGLGFFFSAIGLVATITFWNFPSGKISTSALEEIITKLKQNKTKYIYTTYAVLDSQIMFYSDEEIIARSQWLPSRWPEHALKVDAAMNNGENFAIVGYHTDWHGYTFNNVYTTKDIFIAYNPIEVDLKRIFMF